MRLPSVAILLLVWGCGCRHVLVDTPAFLDGPGIRRIGPIHLKNARIDVVPKDSLAMRGFDGILSLNYFRETAVVLDFRKNLIWIRKS